MEAIYHHKLMEEQSTVLDSTFKLKDVAQFVIAIITAAVFIVTMNAKIDTLTSAINELKDNDNKMSIANDLAIKALQNEVNTNGLQISLLQKDVEFLKNGKKP
jgi:hypothetical protein